MSQSQKKISSNSGSNRLVTQDADIRMSSDQSCKINSTEVADSNVVVSPQKRVSESPLSSKCDKKFKSSDQLHHQINGQSYVQLKRPLHK